MKIKEKGYDLLKNSLSILVGMTKIRLQLGL